MRAQTAAIRFRRPRAGGVVRLPTEKQLRVLRAIAKHLEARGYAPSIRELGRALKIRSTNGIADHLRALERKGLVIREEMIARSLRITEKGRLHLVTVSDLRAAAPEVAR